MAENCQAFLEILHYYCDLYDRHLDDVTGGWLSSVDENVSFDDEIESPQASSIFVRKINKEIYWLQQSMSWT